jgi:hypothetical protein
MRNTQNEEILILNCIFCMNALNLKDEKHISFRLTTLQKIILPSSTAIDCIPMLLQLFCRLYSQKHLRNYCFCYLL